MLRYLDSLVTIDAKAHEERYARAVLRSQTGQREDALRDCEYLLENAGENDVDLDAVHELKRQLQKK